MNGAILITKYWENCADCPLCEFTDYELICNAVWDKEARTKWKVICTREEYYSNGRCFHDLDANTLWTEYQAPRPEWCPLIEVGGTE